MKHDTIIINKIVADEGFVLTDGEAYGKEIYLGKNDKPENWHEITDMEYQEILKEQEEMLENMPEYEVEIQEDVLETEVQEDTLEQEVDIP